MPRPNSGQVIIIPPRREPVKHRPVPGLQVGQWDKPVPAHRMDIFGLITDNARLTARIDDLEARMEAMERKADLPWWTKLFDFGSNRFRSK